MLRSVPIEMLSVHRDADDPYLVGVRVLVSEFDVASGSVNDPVVVIAQDFDNVPP